jgi:transcriptional regulator with XRE-family HTH domain
MTNRPGPFAQRIAAELRAEMARQKMSGRALAEAIGANHATVARWINGDTDPGLDGLEPMCRALSLSVADLIAAVMRNGGYEVTPLPAPRPQRTRRTTAGKTTDTQKESGRNPHRFSDTLVAA